MLPDGCQAEGRRGIRLATHCPSDPTRQLTRELAGYRLCKGLCTKLSEDDQRVPQSLARSAFITAIQVHLPPGNMKCHRHQRTILGTPLRREGLAADRLECVAARGGSATNH